MHVKVFGIQRTGTNYLGFLISKNIIIDKEASILADPSFGDHKPGGWKHGPIYKPPGLDLELRKAAKNKAIILIKNPYTWYTSILKWTKGTKRFDYDGFGGRSPKHMFAVYNELYSKYRSFLEGSKMDTAYVDGVKVRYEDLIENPKLEIKRIAKELGVETRKDFINTNKVPQSRVFSSSQRAYYIEQAPSYSQDTIDRVTAEVNWGLMSFYGYKKIQ